MRLEVHSVETRVSIESCDLYMCLDVKVICLRHCLSLVHCFVELCLWVQLHFSCALLLGPLT